MEQTLYNIIAPVRIKNENQKWDKIRIGSVIFLGLFILGTSAYFGYWYTTGWQDMKSDSVFTPIPQTIINNTYDETFCPLNISEFNQNLKPKGLNSLISY